VAGTFERVFGTAEDERVVLSVCAVPCSDAAAGWRLIHGALIAVPKNCAGVSWGEWCRAEGRDRGSKLGPLPAELVV
jgi:hypothetical protein